MKWTPKRSIAFKEYVARLTGTSYEDLSRLTLTTDVGDSVLIGDVVITYIGGGRIAVTCRKDVSIDRLGNDWELNDTNN